MYKRIDNCTETIEGFSYANKNGITEVVTISDDPRIVKIEIDSESVAIYTEDIPKLVKALLAAEDHLRHTGGS
jgi:hypothetical protein